MKKACFLITVLILAAFTGCSKLGFLEQTDLETGETSKVWKAEIAQDTVNDLKAGADVVASVSKSPWAILASCALGVVSGCLGIVAKVNNSDKKKVLNTLKETVCSAVDLMQSEDAKQFLQSVKDIQDINKTREIVAESLDQSQNIASKIDG